MTTVRPLLEFIGINEPHGSGGLLLGGQGLGGRHLLATLAPKSGLNAVSNAGREFVGPLVDRLIGHANCICRRGHGPAEHVDGFSLSHA